MSEGDRQVNRELAAKLFQNVMGGKPGRTLDIGAKLPVFAAELWNLGCEAWTFEHEPIQHEFTAIQNVLADFEDYAGFQPSVKFNFISLIHTFEHLYDPIKAIQKLRSLVSDGSNGSNGAVFIRLPDHSVNGFERDLTDGHYAIHPFYHSLSSVLQLLYETGNTFEVVDSWILDGVGQRDIVLRPIDKAPKIALGMIVKNEERDLPRILKSVEKAVDSAIIIDTGSTDRTMEVALQGSFPVTIKRYTGASRKDETGDWKLEDFSKARNVYLGEAHRAGADWILNLDADDELVTPDAIRRASYWSQVDGFSVWISDGGVKWLTHRMWKANMGARYEGRAHEYPDLHNMKLGQLDSALLIHHGEPSANQEDSNVRNLRILMLEWQEKPSARCAFYIANTHRDGGRWHDAAEWYQRRIDMGEHYRDEWLFAHLYGARAMVRINKIALAMETLEEAWKSAPDWMEFQLELARIAYDGKNWLRTIMLATPCVRAPIPPTNLWREPSAYTDQPARLISWSHEHLGNWGQALAWSEVAMELIGGPDQEWMQRHDRLRKLLLIGEPPRAGAADTKGGDTNVPACTRQSDGSNVVTGGAHPKPRIALHRPGAIGDILMTLNLVPLLKEKYPDHAIDYFTAWGAEDQLGNIIKAAGCDEVYSSAAWDTFKKGTYDQSVNLIGYPLVENYPAVPMRRHLLQYFAEEMGLDKAEEEMSGWLVGKPPVLPSLSLPKPPAPLKTGPYATLQRKAGWSKYKEWPDERWDELRHGLLDADIPVYEIDEKQGLPLSTVIAIFANATMHIGIDSFCNHLSHYLWDGKRVPAVILWGSTQWDAAGYPTNVNISKGLPCQPCFRETHPNSLHPRGPCINLTPAGTHSCMYHISVEEVLKAACSLWEKSSDKG